MKEKVSVIVGEPTGFCSGVKRAIAIVKKAANIKKSQVYTLGPIIHNNEVVKELKDLGIKTILDVNKLKKTNKKATIIIRSHGCAPEVIVKVKKLGYQVIDATCPYVKRVQNYASRLKNEGYLTIVVGDKHHPEVQGILGYAKPKAKVYDIKSEVISHKSKPNNNIGIVGQTTISSEEFERAINSLNLNKIQNVKVYNTLCKESLNRQKTCREIAQKVNAMVVIGSKNSANTLTLVDIAQKVNHNVYQVENKVDLKKLKIEIKNLKFKNVGVIAGASTPQNTVLDVVREIKKSLLRERYANG